MRTGVGAYKGNYDEMSIQEDVEYFAKFDWYKMTPAMEALSKEADKENAKRTIAVHELCERVGTTTYLERGGIEGFVFDGGPPEGWRKAGRLQGRNYYMPRASGEAKALYDEIRALVMPSARVFSRHFCDSPFGMPPTSETAPGGGRLSRAATYTDIGSGRLFGWPNTALKGPEGISLDDLEHVPLSVIIADMENEL